MDGQHFLMKYLFIIIYLKTWKIVLKVIVPKTRLTKIKQLITPQTHLLIMDLKTWKIVLKVIVPKTRLTKIKQLITPQTPTK